MFLGRQGDTTSRDDRKAEENMASANWMKMTSQRAGAMTIHLGTEERATHDHSNKHIDPEKSYLNTTIGCSDYKEALQKLRDRNAEVDKVLPPQRDMGAKRVVACSIEIPCPYQIQEQGKDQEFFETMYKAMQDYFGTENVHGGFVHRDEQHLYHNKHGDECISLYHMHTLVSPYTAEKGINGKAFETRKRLKEFNAVVNRECERVFGVELNTHTMEEGGQSVELLKAQEAVNVAKGKLRTIEDTIEMQEDTLQGLDSDVSEVTQLLENSHEALEQNKEDAAMIQSRIEVKQDKEQKLDKSIESKSKQLDSIQGSVKAAKDLRKEEQGKVLGLFPKKTVTIPYDEYKTLQKTARAVDNVFKQAEEVNQRKQAVTAKESQIEPLKAELESSIREYHAKTRAVERDFDHKMSVSFEKGKQAGKEEIENQLSQLHNKQTGQSLLEIFQTAWIAKLKKEKSHEHSMER